MDLDGTLIKTDLLWESLAILLTRNPLSIFPVLFWWTRGRAYLKHKLGGRVQVDAASLPCNESFLNYLRTEKEKGRTLILATASDRKMAQPVFDHVGLFDELLASDGKTNLRGEAKRTLLVERFGERGFDYAGNSSVDLGVWPSAREAVVVNASRDLVEQAAQQTKLGPAFIEGYSPLFQSKRILCGLFIESRYLYAIIGGLLLTAAFPKIGIAGLAWVAPAFILAAAYGKCGTNAFRIGYVAGLAHFLSSLYWLLCIPVPGYPILGWLALSAYVALYPAVWVWLASSSLPLINTGLQPGDRAKRMPPAASAAYLTRRETVETVQTTYDSSNTGLKPGVNESRNASDSWVHRTLWSLAGAATWVALEMIRARLMSGFPWNPLGASQFQLTPLIQIASVTGVYGVSFLVVWTSLSLFSAVLAILRKPTARYGWGSEIFLPMTVIIAIFFFGMARLREQNTAGPTLRVTFVQPSIPQTMIWDTTENSNRFQQVIELSEKALTNETDLLIWPEAALPSFDEASFTTITNLIHAHRVWMIFGADDSQEKPDATANDRYDFYNAAHLFDPDGRYMTVYRKQKLVIFGEYIPLVRWLPFIKWFTPITGGFTAGRKPVPFELERRAPPRPEPDDAERAETALGVPTRVKISTLICFEDAFPHLVPEYVDDDTDFLVNLTNDGWFGESAEQWQHAAMAVFRAVENGLPLVRSCNNGLTCWVDSHGRIRQIFRDKTGSIYGAGIMIAQIPILAADEKHARTFYNEHGDCFGWSCVGIAFVAALVRARRKAAAV